MHLSLAIRATQHLGLTVLAMAALASSGCALTSKGEALSIRWFTPESVKPRLTSASKDARPAEGALAVELGRVTSGINLREKIAYRDAAFEVGFYDDNRWTERPEVYVRRELARTLFEDHGMRRVLGGRAPILDVEVISFEELRGPQHAARIRLRILVHDDQGALLEKTITVDRPVPAGAKGFDGLVQTLAEALAAATEEVAKATEDAVRTASAQAAPSSDQRR